MKALLSVHYILWLVLSALFFAVGEYFSKKFALSPSAMYVSFILIAYGLGTFAWLPAILEKNSLSIAGTIWSLLSLLATVLIGVFLFSEKLSGIGIVGVLLAFVAIVLLSVA